MFFYSILMTVQVADFAGGGLLCVVGILFGLLERSKTVGIARTMFCDCLFVSFCFMKCNVRVMVKSLI